MPHGPAATDVAGEGAVARKTSHAGSSQRQHVDEGTPSSTDARDVDRILKLRVPVIVRIAERKVASDGRASARPRQHPGASTLQRRAVASDGQQPGGRRRRGRQSRRTLRPANHVHRRSSRTRRRASADRASHDQAMQTAATGVAVEVTAEQPAARNHEPLDITPRQRDGRRDLIADVVNVDPPPARRRPGRGLRHRTAVATRHSRPSLCCEG